MENNLGGVYSVVKQSDRKHSHQDAGYAYTIARNISDLWK